MSNLFYQQLERECDPDLLHIHLTVDEVKLLEFSITHIPAIKGNPNTYRLANKFRTFLEQKMKLDSATLHGKYICNDKDVLVQQLEHERIVLAIARGSDYSGVKALAQAIKIIKEIE